MSILLVITCLILLTCNQVINGLYCFSCTNCNDPFSRSTTQIVQQNDGLNYSCSKTSIGYITARSMFVGCVSFGTIGNGQWCCQTDLCNRAKKNILINKFCFALNILIFIILLLK